MTTTPPHTDPPALLALARHGLAPDHDHDIEALRQEPFDTVVHHAATNQLLPSLVALVGEGALPVDADEREQLQRAVADTHRASVVLERDLVAVHDLLAAFDVPVRVLKGVANAHLDRADPSERTFGDIDVLVPGAHIELAALVLEAHGWERPHPPPRPGFDARYEKSILLRGPEGREVDLHRILLKGPFGHTLPPDDLFEAGEEFDLAGRTMTALDRETRFVHACMAATVSDRVPRLRPAREVIVQLDRPGLDPDRVLERAHRWGAGILVAEAIRSSLDRLEVERRAPLSTWARRYRPSGRERRWRSCYGQDYRAHLRRELGTIATRRGLGDRTGYTLALLHPERVNTTGSATARAARAVRRTIGR